MVEITKEVKKAEKIARGFLEEKFKIGKPSSDRLDIMTRIIVANSNAESLDVLYDKTKAVLLGKGYFHPEINRVLDWMLAIATNKSFDLIDTLAGMKQIHERYCVSCLIVGRLTILAEEDHRGGTYYYCSECKGAVETITRNAKAGLLLVDVDPAKSPNDVSAKIKELLFDVTIGPNGSPHTLEVRSRFERFSVKALIKRIEGIKEITVPVETK